MDRMEEYRRLLAALEETPPALEGTVRRAVSRRRRGRWAAVPAGSLAAVFAAFVLLVNLSTPFALACSGVPVLKELTAAVAFSPSLRAAVEHDFVQYIGQTQEKNGLTMTLSYLIPDQGQLLFFASVTGPERGEHVMIHPRFTGEDGEELAGFASTSRSFETGVLSDAFTLLAAGGEEPVLPAVLGLECQVEAGGASALFSFSVPLDKALLAQGERVEVGRWLELDGSRIYVDSLEIYAAHGRLNLEEDPENAETLQSLSFYLEDEAGNRYAQGSSSGVLSMGNAYWFESPFFARPRSLTLHVTGAVWLEKGRESVALDLKNGRALGPLPEGVSVSVCRWEDGRTGVAFIAPEPPGSTEDHSLSYQIGTTIYRTPDGAEHDTGGVSRVWTDRLWYGTPDEVPVPEGCFVEEFFLDDYPGDIVEWDLYFTRRTAFGEPVVLALK